MSAAQPTAEPSLQTIVARRDAIRGSVIAGAELTGPYVAMNVAAALIAGFASCDHRSNADRDAIWPDHRHRDGASSG